MCIVMTSRRAPILYRVVPDDGLEWRRVACTVIEKSSCSQLTIMYRLSSEILIQLVQT
jgi:hypothetical protein